MHRTPYDRCFVAVVTAVVLVTVPASAQQVSDVERRYQAALHTEQVEGNLTAALKAYEGLAATTTIVPEIRLKALVRQAGIHETLGLAPEPLYQRVIREFPSRPEAATAQRKLAARAAAAEAAAAPRAAQTQTPAPTTSTGSTVFTAVPRTRTVTRILVAQLNDDGRLSAWQPRALQNATVTSYVQFGPDNRHVVYVTGTTVRVQDVFAPDDPGREVYKGGGGLTSCVWSRTLFRVYCGERKGIDTEIIAIDVATLSVERMATLGGLRFPLHITADDRVLSFNKDSNEGTPVGAGGISWVIGSDPPSETPLSRLYAVDRSDDGQWVVDNNTERLLPASGSGQSWPLERNVPRNAGFIPESVRFTVDSQWVIFRGRDAEGKDGMYRVSTATGAKERLGDHPQVTGRAWMRFSPDGRNFLIAMDVVAPVN